MKKFTKFPVPGFGATSLLATFGVLCLAVLAMVCITTARTERMYSEASTQAVSDFYMADRQAQEIYARLKLGETVDGVQVDGDIYRYFCPVSQVQVLEVEVRKTDDGWEVLKWHAVATPENAEDVTLPVWDGNPDDAHKDSP